MQRRYSHQTYPGYEQLSTSMYHIMRRTNNINKKIETKTKSCSTNMFTRHFRSDSDAGQLMYIVSFLHKAMKRTQEVKGFSLFHFSPLVVLTAKTIGVGGELIMGLFQEILVSSKQKLLPKWSPVFTTLDDKVLVTMFQSFLANPDKVS